MKKVLVVGGVAGGASTATRLRRLDEKLEIVLFEKGEHVSFANCGLPYHIGNVIENRQSLLVQTPDSFKARFNLDVRVNSEVIAIDPTSKTISVKNLAQNDEVYQESFDYLVLSPGAKPVMPPIKGIESPRLFTLRNMADMDSIKEAISKYQVKQAVVVGGGFIGVESAENLQHLGIKTTLIEAAPHILASFDSEMSSILEFELGQNGVNVLTNEKVVEFKTNESEIQVVLESNKQVKADLVIFCIGVAPDTKFLQDSGVKLGARGHILVNEFLETNFPYIYALGDAILVNNFVTDEQVAIPLAGPANRQGRIVANNICGQKEQFKGSLGTSILKVFALSAASTGINEREALKQGLKLGSDFDKLFLFPNDHASYYPGATPISIKLLYVKETQEVLGAQAIGLKGVDKFIDVIATTLKFKGTLSDLAELELAYAPPFLSAKSPANMAGFIGLNIEQGLIKQIFVDELAQIDPQKQVIVDVREEIEAVKGSFANSINFPLSSLRQNYIALPKDKELLVYCAVGLRGYIAARFLAQQGFKVRNIAGGFSANPKEFEYVELKLNEQATKVKTSCCSDNMINTTANAPHNTGTSSTLSQDTQGYLDLSGLSCPGPLVKVKENLDKLNSGELLKVKVSDLGFYNDVQSFCKLTKNTLVSLEKNDSFVFATLQKGSSLGASSNSLATAQENRIIEGEDGLTIVVFSGDLDKAMAAFIIANGALAMGKKVTLFFTFWGLSIIKKQSLPKQNFMEKMFSLMLPKNSQTLPVSKMNFFGLGAKMIRSVMQQKQVMPLEELIQKCIEGGATLTACTMSMDVMGISKDELIDGVSLGGVGQYLGATQEAKTNLFI